MDFIAKIVSNGQTWKGQRNNLIDFVQSHGRRTTELKKK